MYITIPMTYDYVGGMNCYVTLASGDAFEPESVTLLSGYGEHIATVSCGEDLATVLSDLSAGKFAENSLSYLLEHAEEI